MTDEEKVVVEKLRALANKLAEQATEALAQRDEARSCLAESMCVLGGYHWPGVTAGMRTRWNEALASAPMGADESVLLATTAGSPDKHQCPNRLHRMKVQVATSPSNEEAAALVLCECDRGTDGGSP